MKQYVRLLPSLVLMGACATGFAQTQSEAQAVWQQIKGLLAQGQVQQAYELGQKNLDVWEGTPDFDYYYGMAAIDAGYVAEGSFALERVLYQAPNFQAAKLELARAYYLMKQYPLAKRHFKAVLDVSPPASVIERINTFMALIEQAENEHKPKVLAYFEVIGGHDSNANYAPASETFNSPTLGQGELTDDGTAQSAWFNDTLAGIGYYKPINKQTTLYSRVDLAEHNVNQSHPFDSFTYTIQGGVIHKLSDDDNLSAQLIHQQYHVDGGRYRELNGLAGSWMHVLNPVSSLQLGASYLNFIYNDLNNKDAEEYNLSLGYNRQVPWFGTSLIQARLSFGQDDPNEDNEITRSTTEKDFWGMSLTHKTALNAKVILTSTLAFLNSEYAEDDLLFLTAREDDSLSFEMKADWRWDEHWQLSLAAGWREQDSNIEIYDYDRTYGQLGVRYEYY
ncbi:MAG: hypothetical protein AseanaTS_25290 [Candidatus Pelagadaptatus aseana]|uniref:hypothetical protein n=1 Tax=Candidatus Pelagadaptatus aseana TaxID=3120508 RepID=UPI0039B24D1D